MFEDYDEKVHPERHANKTISAMGPNPEFKKLVEMINSIPSERVGTDQLREELELFGKTVPDPVSAFPDRNPDLEIWRKRRELYALPMPNLTEEEYGKVMEEQNKLPDEELWWHDMRISVFFRKPFNVKEKQYQEIAEKIKARMPALNWDDLMQYIEHKNENCVRGDIFKHHNKKHFGFLSEFDRGQHTQSQQKFDQFQKDQDERIARGELPDPEKEYTEEE